MSVLCDVAWPPEPMATERLVLRRTRASDRPGCIELACSEEVRRYLGGPRPREAVERETPAVPGDYPGAFAVDLDGACIGVVIVERRDAARTGHLEPAGNELEVSYLFLPAYWGRGYASEAVAAVLGWAGRECPGEPVLLCTQVANERSLALARRVGFTELDRFREHDAEQWLGVRRPGARTL